jgi:DNA polymerase I
MKQLFLVDGSSYLFRAFHAMPNLQNSERQATGAIYGVINMLRRLEEQYKPTHMVVVFDAKGSTFRNEMYPEYKANRPPMPDDLRSQIEPIHRAVVALGLPLLCERGVEADDVIGTLSRSASADGVKVTIVSSDKDLAQLVDSNVVMLDTMKDITYDIEGVKSKFGVLPEQIIDYLTLIGDTSDNIPGVPKVGPKTAAKWLEQYNDLDTIIAHADDIKGKVGENLRASLDQIELSRQLVTIKCDVSLHADAESMRVLEVDETVLRELFATYEFRSWLAELGGADEEEPENVIEVDYDLILTKVALVDWISRLRASGTFAIDTETTSVNSMTACLVGFSFCCETGKAAYLPVAHDYENAPEQLSLSEVNELLGPLLSDASVGKVGQNLKYDQTVLENHGFEINGIVGDTMLSSYVLDSTGSRHDMDTLASKYLGLKTIKFEDVAGKGKNQITFNKVELEVAKDYAAEDADITFRLFEYFESKLDSEPTLRKLLTEVELPLLSVLSRIERNGVGVNVDMLYQQSAELKARTEQIEAKSHDVAGEVFNIASPKQIQHIFFEKLGLPVISKTPKGQPSTAENVLQELAENYELPSLILEHRSLIKLKSTYTDKLPLIVNPATGRIHTSYHQAVAATGRLSSSDPNLQNIPIRTAEGRRIREAFVADSGNQLVAIDYSQIELRIMAHLSEDVSLLSAFAERRDVHRATAAEVFGVDDDQVSDDQRRSAKAINFGLIYGMSAFGLGRQLGIDRKSAQEYIDLYFERYPGVKKFMDTTREVAKEKQYVETVFGRRLYLPEIRSSNFQRRQYAERTAINAPMQGTAADLIKMAMIKVDQWILTQQPQVRMILQVHDELVLEAPKELISEVTEIASAIMIDVAQLRVPLEVEAGVGENWAQAH